MGVEGQEQETEFTLVLELEMKGYGLDKHKDDMAERVLRELETKFGYDAFKVYQIKEGLDSDSTTFTRVKKRVYRSDRNAAATDAGVGE